MMFRNLNLCKPMVNYIRSIHIERELSNLGLKLPQPSSSKKSFVDFVRRGNTIYLSGHLPQPAEGALITGKVGKDVSVEQGYEASKIVGINLIASLVHNKIDLDKVKVTKIFGLVNCTDGFSQQPAVINGCSDLFLKLFGSENGKHARSAVGTVSSILSCD